MSLTIRHNQVFVMDPSDSRMVTVDWDAEALPDDVEIDSSTFTITAIKQNGVTALTKDNPGIVSGNRKTKVRLIATTATAGDKYKVDNTIVTNESPTQTMERCFYVLVQNQ